MITNRSYKNCPFYIFNYFELTSIAVNMSDSFVSLCDKIVS